MSSEEGLVFRFKGGVPFVNELETLVGNQFIAKHDAFFNLSSNTTFHGSPKAN